MSTEPMAAHRVPAEPKRRHEIPVWVWLAVASALTIALFVLSLVFTHRANSTASQADDLASRVQTACSQGGAPAAKLNALGACGSAGKVKQVTAGVPGAAGATGATGAQGPAGATPSGAALDTAVSNYLAAHPPAAGHSATTGQVTAAVTDYLTAHPAKPGRPPTDGEITAATTGYLSAHPGQFVGPAGAAGVAGANGKDGTNGSNGVDGSPGAKGDTGAMGATGPAGDSFAGQQFVTDSSGNCVSRVTTRHADGSTTDADSPAGAAACPATPPPTSSASLLPSN